MKSIKFKGNTYIIDEEYWDNSIPNSSPEFQHKQLLYCLEIKDYNTLENRITNMLKWGGIKIQTNE